ncbi:MAG: KpsF/GutQ family protein [Rhodomicrobium sp.]|nr:MAG: KpsF/GutQ family protein [Rhodomicrobium sp.]
MTDMTIMQDTSPTALASGLRTIEFEINALKELEALLSNGMGALFSRAVEMISRSEGRVIISGIGKSGHVGQKIAATFASTGTPAFFVHPSEASHGDLGMIRPEDIIVALSWSGETVELTNIITYSRRFKVPLIAITSNENSALGRNSDVVLALPKVQEACPHNLAPTSSTIMQLAIGDALAIALLEAKGFSAVDFKTFHPGGNLGAKLRLVKDLMHVGERLPLVSQDMPMGEALVTMTEKSFGCLGALDGSGRLVGVITDGDLRRNMQADLLSRHVRDVMKPSPITIHEEMLASAALEQINASSITALFVLRDEKPIGIVHIHDLLRAGVA